MNKDEMARSLATLKGNETRQLSKATSLEEMEAIRAKFAQKRAALGVVPKEEPFAGMTGERQISYMLKKICKLFGQTEGETDAALSKPFGEQKETLISTFGDITDAEFNAFPKEEQDCLRAIGFKTEREAARALIGEEAMAQLTAENCVVMAMFGQSGLLASEELIDDAKMIYTQYRGEEPDVEFEGKCLEVIKLFANPAVGFLLQDGECFRVNLDAKLNR